VLPAVNFDNQTALAANEVDNEWTNRLLPNELTTIDCA
jgi:hypothetical protein